MRTMICGGKIVLPDGTITADLLVADEKIAFVGKDLAASFSADRTVDATDKFILPGLIDAHVHMPWKRDSFSSGDDFSSGTRAAVWGGVTTIIDFAIPADGEPLSVAVDKRRQEAIGSCYTDFAFHAVINHFSSTLVEEIAAVVKAGIPSFKLYMLYPGLALNDGEIYEIMRWVKQAGGLIGIHAENGAIIDTLTALLVDRGNTNSAYQYASRPQFVESEAINRMLFLNHIVDGKMFFVHVSSQDSLALIAQAKHQGDRVYAETCPHYLLLTAEKCAGPDGYLFLVSPSLKNKADVETLWAGCEDGTVDFVSTDHCPFSRTQKAEHKDDFSKIPNGLPGVETRLPLMITEGYENRHLSLERIVQLTSYNPARILGLYPRKGTLQVGSDADLVILDTERETVLSYRTLHMHVDWSPYEGRTVRGFPDLVMRRGEILVEQGAWVADQARGRFIPRVVEGIEDDRSIK